MAYTQPYGSGLQKKADEKSALYYKDTKKVRLNKSQYREDGLTDYAKSHATIKPANFWRKNEKAVISVPKEDFYSSKSKLINTPTTFYGADKKETTSWDDAVRYSGAAPSAHHQRKENVKENIKLGATLGGAAAIWRNMSGGKWII